MPNQPIHHPTPPQPLSQPSDEGLPSIDQLLAGLFETEPNSMGLYQIYPTHPTFIPPNNSSLVSRTDAPTLEGEWVTESSNIHVLTGFTPPDVDTDNIFNPFTNPTCGLMMSWRYTGTNEKSDAEVNQLAHFHHHPNFMLEDVPVFNCACKSKLMDAYLQDRINPMQEEFGWHQSTVKIHLPKE
jgi:hypothetical protein